MQFCFKFNQLGASAHSLMKFIRMQGMCAHIKVKYDFKNSRISYLNCPVLFYLRLSFKEGKLHSHSECAGKIIQFRSSFCVPRQKTFYPSFGKLYHETKTRIWFWKGFFFFCQRRFWQGQFFYIFKLYALRFERLRKASTLHLWRTDRIIKHPREDILGVHSQLI